MENNILDFKKEKEKIEIKTFLNNLKLGKMIEIKDIGPDGIVDIYEFGIHTMGFVFGYDFVTFSKEHKVYPINLEMDDDYFSDSDETGIYVTELTDMEDTNLDYISYLRENLDLAREVTKWYFNLFINKEEIKYEKDSKDLMEADLLYTELADKTECQIYDFNKCKK